MACRPLVARYAWVMVVAPLRFTSLSADALADFAGVLAHSLTPGDVIMLSGDVGAGKTHFARALIQSILQTPEDVPSPTFTLVQTYDTTRGSLWHTDLSRLTSTSELEELGLFDAFEDAICLVEWPDRLGAEAPSNALWITLTASNDAETRSMEVTWQGDTWARKLDQWATV